MFHVSEVELIVDPAVRAAFTAREQELTQRGERTRTALGFCKASKGNIDLWTLATPELETDGKLRFEGGKLRDFERADDHDGNRFLICKLLLDESDADSSEGVVDIFEIDRIEPMYIVTIQKGEAKV